MAVNRRVLRDPSLVHRSPYSAGWLLAVEPSDARYTRLPYGPPSRPWFSAEAIRFARALEHRLGTAAADGGELVAPGATLLGDEDWDELMREFLGARPVERC